MQRFKKKAGGHPMLKMIKKNLWNVLCAFWAMIVALFWFSMRVIWSGISKVLYEAMGKKEPTAFLLNFPLSVSIVQYKRGLQSSQNCKKIPGKRKNLPGNMIYHTAISSRKYCMSSSSVSKLHRYI